jgi:hypothetical protein
MQISGQSGRTVLGVTTKHASYWLIATLVFLFVANIFDPLGTLGLKRLAFLSALLWPLWTLKYFNLSSRELTIGLTLFVVWPTWALFYGAVRGGDMTVGLTQVTPFVFAWFLAVILPALDTRLPLRAFYACISSLAVVVVVAFALIIFLPDNAVSQTVFGYLTSLEGKEGSFGTQSFDGLEVPWIYFSSTLFLVPAFVYYLFVGRLLRAGVILLALGLTFSKAGVTIALIFGAIYAGTVLLRRSVAGSPNGSKTHLRVWLQRFVPVIVVGGIAILIFLSLPSFSDNSTTAEVRIGHFQSVIDLFRNHASVLLIGQGAGVPFYSLGQSDYVQSFEIDYLNITRKFGLPWFIGYSAVVFYTARRLIKTRQMEERAFGFALVSGYLAAGTNPELLSSLFITLMILSYFAQRRPSAFPRARNSRAPRLAAVTLPQVNES